MIIDTAKLTTEQIIKLAEALDVPVNDLTIDAPVAKKTTEADFYLSKDDTAKFWGRMYDEIAPHASVLSMWYQEMMRQDNESEGYAGIEFLSYFLQNRENFIEGSLYAMYAPIFGDLPAAVVYAYTHENDYDNRQALWNISALIDKYDHLINEFTKQARAENKMALYESFLIEA